MDLLLQIALFLLLGVVLHSLDSYLGTALYRGWYNMTHKDPLAAGERRGFLQQQPLRIRLFWALALTGIAATAVLVSGTFFQDTTRILLNLLAMLVGLFAGFLLAPSILAAFPDKWKRASRYLEETEKTNATTKPVPPAAGSVPPEPVIVTPPEAAPPAASLPPPPSTDPPPTPKTPDWRKGVDEFLKKP
ncbi:MAG: hypothetical protein GC205_10255 [Bacteroidetes bacterium]|nr:hypothetical protein [Bacteroidota bacterium]